MGTGGGAGFISGVCSPLHASPGLLGEIWEKGFVCFGFGDGLSWVQ